jgi:3-hydroxy-9,10-secoandrosta-1,3,5(10)-triene-9,17-dione monooxygenase reductase component
VSSPDSARFRQVLGHFVTGVVVITASTPDGPAGFTCQTFGSISLEPSLISFSARTASHSWPRIREVGVLGVNILSAEQEPLATVFATTGTEKFAGVSWSPGPGGAPLIEGALAHLEGRVVSVSAQGDHDIVVVGVDFVASHTGRPLVYYRGGFSTLD